MASARFTAPDKIKLLQNSLVELIKMDVATGYQMCFVYIRQLAASLRNAHTTKSHSNARQSITSWQFLRCIQLWSQLLCDEPSLQPLVYPLVQICLSCIKWEDITVIFSSYYFVDCNKKWIIFLFIFTLSVYSYHWPIPMVVMFP